MRWEGLTDSQMPLTNICRNLLALPMNVEKINTLQCFHAHRHIPTLGSASPLVLEILVNIWAFCEKQQSERGRRTHMSAAEGSQQFPLFNLQRLEEASVWPVGPPSSAGLFSCRIQMSLLEARPEQRSGFTFPGRQPRYSCQRVEQKHGKHCSGRNTMERF